MNERLLPRHEFASLERPAPERAQQLAAELDADLVKSAESAEKVERVEPRLTFLFPLERDRTSALDILRAHKSEDQKEISGWHLTEEERHESIAMLRNPDFVVRDAALYSLSKGTEIEQLPDLDRQTILLLAEEMKKSNDPRMRKDAAMALRHCGVEATPHLKDLIKDQSPEVKFVTISALAELGTPESLEILAEAANDEQERIRVEVVRNLARYGAAAEPILKKIRTESRIEESELGGALDSLELQQLDPNAAVDYIKARVAKGDRGEAVALMFALNSLENEKRQPIESLISADPTLRKFVEDYQTIDARKEAIETKKNKRRTGKRSEQMWLLSSQKPLFATRSTEVLTKRLKSLDQKVNRLQQKYGKDFVGIAVWGSTAGGYMKRGSDLDATVIVASDEAREAAEKAFYTDVFSPTLQLETGGEVDKSFGPNLFEGIFFGDRRRLVEIQKELLESVDDEEWDAMRSEIYDKNITHLTREGYAQKRLGVRLEELDTLEVAASLTRVPPTREKALEIVTKRLAKTRASINK